MKFCCKAVSLRQKGQNCPLLLLKYYWQLETFMKRKYIVTKCFPHIYTRFRTGFKLLVCKGKKEEGNVATASREDRRDPDQVLCKSHFHYQFLTLTLCICGPYICVIKQPNSCIINKCLL